MKKLLFLLVASVSILLVACGSSNTTTLEVFGMNCMACEARLTEALEDVGVEVIVVSRADNRVEFKFDDRVITLEEIRQIIFDTGFTLE